MKKALCALMLFCATSLPSAWGDGYGGLAVGLGEVCDNVGDTSFTGDECRNPGVIFRGFLGKSLNDFTRLEVSLDTLFDPRRWFGWHGDTHVTALTLGGYALANLPFTDDMNFFFGPGVGASIVHVAWGYENYYDSNQQERYGTSSSNTNFGFNYGWTLGAEFAVERDTTVRIQWQTWNSLDSDELFDKELSANYLSLSLRQGF